QPAELPLLFFLRHKQPTSARGPDKQQTSLMVIDRRDGSLVLTRDNIPIQQTNYYELSGNRYEDSITISLTSNRGGGGGSNAKLFTFKLTDAPAPPEPPAQTGAAASAKPEVSVKRKLGTFGRIIGDALRGPLPARNDLPEFPPEGEAPPPE
ncbi:MAG TPA: hypothetical protein VL096_06170, partial [Pirellulaceae bacterium]|nr:hypothetical protein [Pirellulaceae bacterium]